MYWKYHLEAGDLVVFDYDGKRAAGTVRKIRIDQPTGEIETTDDLDLSKCFATIKSGKKTVEVNFDDLVRRTPKDERETDIPMLSERMRLSGGVEHK